jgi:histone-lysine N-methyltransferase SETMAR
MEQRIFIKITFEDGLNAVETFRKLVERYGKDALSYPSVTYWRREFRGGRKDVEDGPRTGRPPDFGIRLRIERALEDFPNGSVRTIAASTGYESSTVFYVLTQVLHLKFRHWRWIPHLLSDAQKVARVEGANSLRSALLTAKHQNWNLFWTGDESWVLWDTQRSGSWLEIDQELPVRVKQTIGARKSMLTVFFNPRRFAVVDLLPQGATFDADYFVAQVIRPLHALHSTASGDIARRKLCLHFDNSPCHTAHVVVDEMARLRCRRVPHPPYSPDLAISDFYLFGRIKGQLAGKTIMDENYLKSEIMEILGGISEDEVRRAFDHWIERCEWVENNRGDYYHP